jgi:hypothetical protein
MRPDAMRKRSIQSRAHGGNGHGAHKVTQRQAETAPGTSQFDFARVLTIYKGSNSAATRMLYRHLEKIGPAGIIAANLFRASKSSQRAKVYRGGIRGQGSFRGMAYRRKKMSLENLAMALSEHAVALKIKWGWGIDEEQTHHRHVLYVDPPTGQLSFHTAEREAGPKYPGKWDGIRGEGRERICRWVAQLLASTETAATSAAAKIPRRPSARQPRVS